MLLSVATESFGQFKPKVTLSISNFGKKSKGCAGFGLGCAKFEFGIGLRLSPENPVLEAQVIDGNYVKIGFVSYGAGATFTSQEKSSFEVEEDTTLPIKLSTDLGYTGKTIILQKGEYKTYEENGITYTNIPYVIK
jgi:hypothetical protein